MEQTGWVCIQSAPMGTVPLLRKHQVPIERKLTGYLRARKRWQRWAPAWVLPVVRLCSTLDEAEALLTRLLRLDPKARASAARLMELH